MSDYTSNALRFRLIQPLTIGLQQIAYRGKKEVRYQKTQKGVLTVDRK